MAKGQMEIVIILGILVLVMAVIIYAVKGGVHS